jgi:hypothetical protein
MLEVGWEIVQTGLAAAGLVWLARSTREAIEEERTRRTVADASLRWTQKGQQKRLNEHIASNLHR